MSIPCLLCGAPPRPRFVSRDYPIVRCDSCDLEWVDPMPTPEQILSIYASGYFTGGGFGYEDYFARERASHRRKAAYRLSLLNRLVAGLPCRLLDFGSADGTFVAEALNLGWDAYGVEVSADARQVLKPDLTPRIFDSARAACASGPYDAITLWDVLEHLPNVVDSLDELAEFMAPQGLMAVVVPVIDNWNARQRPDTWDQYKPPEHLTYFSSQSIKALLRSKIGPVIHEEPAWMRFARRTHPSLSGARKYPRIATWLEERLTRVLVSTGLVKTACLDSLLVVCRKS